MGVPPPLTDHFQDREAASRLAEALAAGPTVVLGLGGTGKSQLAAHHAWRVWRDATVDVAVWVPALSRDAITVAFAEAARVLCERDPDIGNRDRRPRRPARDRAAGRRPGRLPLALAQAAAFIADNPLLAVAQYRPADRHGVQRHKRAEKRQVAVPAKRCQGARRAHCHYEDEQRLLSARRQRQAGPSEALKENQPERRRRPREVVREAEAAALRAALLARRRARGALVLYDLRRGWVSPCQGYRSSRTSVALT